jgi:hypothetical protein
MPDRHRDSLLRLILDDVVGDVVSLLMISHCGDSLRQILTCRSLSFASGPMNNLNFMSVPLPARSEDRGLAGPLGFTGKLGLYPYRP